MSYMHLKKDMQYPWKRGENESCSNSPKPLLPFLFTLALERNIFHEQREVTANTRSPRGIICMSLYWCNRKFCSLFYCEISPRVHLETKQMIPILNQAGWWIYFAYSQREKLSLCFFYRAQLGILRIWIHVDLIERAPYDSFIHASERQRTVAISGKDQSWAISNKKQRKTMG